MSRRVCGGPLLCASAPNGVSSWCHHNLSILWHFLAALNDSRTPVCYWGAIDKRSLLLLAQRLFFSQSGPILCIILSVRVGMRSHAYSNHIPLPANADFQLTLAAVKLSGLSFRTFQSGGWRVAEYRVFICLILLSLLPDALPSLRSIGYRSSIDTHMLRMSRNN